jgi:hypothetical protein
MNVRDVNKLAKEKDLMNLEYLLERLFFYNNLVRYNFSFLSSLFHADDLFSLLMILESHGKIDIGCDVIVDGLPNEITHGIIYIKLTPLWIDILKEKK